MKRCESSGPGTVTTLFSGALLVVGLAAMPAFSQEVFLEFSFDDEAELSDFFVAESTVGCGPNLLMGSASVEDGALVLYWENPPGSRVFAVNLSGATTGTYSTGTSAVYPYYAPERIACGEGHRVKVLREKALIPAPR